MTLAPCGNDCALCDDETFALLDRSFFRKRENLGR
jgi:hypothetical protein